LRVNQIQQHYDVIVIGGGLVGASFACALAAQPTSRPLKILVTEAVQSIEQSSSFDSRSTAISYGSRLVYEEIGIWGDMARSVTAIDKIHVSDRGHFGAARINSASMGVEALGYVAENQHIGMVLTSALKSASSIDFACPATIVSLSPAAQGMRVRIQTADAAEEEISAALVVLADGGKSTLKDQLAISSQVTEYEQHAIITNVGFSSEHHHVAYERFTEEGPLAILPLATINGMHRGALIWTVSAKDVDTVMALPDSAFIALLQKRFGYRLGVFEKAGTRAAYPLRLSIASEQIRPGLVLLGNVAHTLHPVAGQGLNLALRNAQTLAHLLCAASLQQQALGDINVLQQFVNAQQTDQTNTVGFSHTMTKLFSSNNPVQIWVRKFGLISIDLIPAFKTGFARQAMGLAARSGYKN
jgi:2-octaprenyl-6-methoxyphenol hydroxylase